MRSLLLRSVRRSTRFRLLVSKSCHAIKRTTQTHTYPFPELVVQMMEFVRHNERTSNDFTRGREGLTRAYLVVFNMGQLDPSRIRSIDIRTSLPSCVAHDERRLT